MPRLLDRYEELVHSEIKGVADRFDLSVFPKVRVADVLKPETLGVTGALKSYALASHFDFVVCRNKFDTAYAIEFDGASHADPKQIERDAKKAQTAVIARDAVGFAELVLAQHHRPVPVQTHRPSLPLPGDEICSAAPIPS